MRKWAGALLVAGFSCGIADCVSDAPTMVDSGTDGSTLDTGIGSNDAGMDADIPRNWRMFASNASTGNGNNGGVLVFDKPIRSSSMSAFTLGASSGLGNPGGIRIEPGGQHVWMSTGCPAPPATCTSMTGAVMAFTNPIIANAQFAKQLTLGPFERPAGLVFDGANDLWVSTLSFGDGGNVPTPTIQRWAGPSPSGTSNRTITLPPVTVDGGFFAATITALEFDGKRLYAGSIVPPYLYVFDDPTTQTTPSFTNASFGAPVGGLLVANGRLYVTANGNSFQGITNATISSYALPLTAQSTPQVLTSGVAPKRPSLTPSGELVISGLMANTITFLGPPSGPNAFSTTVFQLPVNVGEIRAIEFLP